MPKKHDLNFLKVLVVWILNLKALIRYSVAYQRNRNRYGKRMNLLPQLMWCKYVRRWADSRSHATSFSPHSLFPVGLKSIAASQSSASNSCFVSCLKSWGPEPHKLPSLCRRIERESSRLFQYILSLKIWSRENKVEQGVGWPVKHGIVKVSRPFSLSSSGRSREGCHSAN